MSFHGAPFGREGERSRRRGEPGGRWIVWLAVLLGVGLSGGGMVAAQGSSDQAANRPQIINGISGNPAATTSTLGTGWLGRTLGLRDDWGVRLGGVWLADTNLVVAGGTQPGGWTSNSAFFLSLAVDADKLVGWTGASFDFQFLQLNAANTNAQAVSVQSCNGITGVPPFQRTEVYQAWYEQVLIRDVLKMRIGRMVPTLDFNNVLRPVALTDIDDNVPSLSGVLYATIFVNGAMLGPPSRSARCRPVATDRNADRRRRQRRRHWRRLPVWLAAAGQQAERPRPRLVRQHVLPARHEPVANAAHHPVFRCRRDRLRPDRRPGARFDGAGHGAVAAQSASLRASDRAHVPFSQIPLDAYTPALPQMARDLAADNAAVQNTVTAYMLGMSLALVPVGLLSDSRGRRPVLFAGMALLVAMSVGCALADDIRTMLVVRFLQGNGGCTCLVIAYAIAADRFRDRELTAVSGLLGAAWGLAPVLAPAAGGFLVAFVSWRVVFLMIAGLAAVAMLAAFLFLPETLERERRTPVDLGRTAALVRGALTDRRFVAFTSVSAAMASAQMVFGVVAPFLYQEQLGYSAAAYGAFALVLGGVNLLGDLACSGLAQRLVSRTLALGAFCCYATRAACLTASGLLIGTGVISLTLAGALVLAGCGTLCPIMYGMALGLFERNLGLFGGLISAICYLVVSGAMAIAAVLPETSPAPLGGLYLALGFVPLVLLPRVLPRTAHASASPKETKAS